MGEAAAGHCSSNPPLPRSVQGVTGQSYDAPDVDPHDPDLVAYWNFDEGEGWTVHDITGKVRSCTSALSTSCMHGAFSCEAHGVRPHRGNLCAALRSCCVLHLWNAPNPCPMQGHDLRAVETPRWEVVRWLSVCGNGALCGRGIAIQFVGGVEAAELLGSQPGWAQRQCWRAAVHK